MDCKQCSAVLDEFEESQAQLDRIDFQLCFQCYLKSEHTLYQYDDYQVSRYSEEENSLVNDALKKKIGYLAILTIEHNPPQSIVIMTVTEEDAVTLLETVSDSQLGQFIEETSIEYLGDLYGELDKRFCWRASAWKHDPHGRMGRAGPMSTNIIAGVPCVTDSYSWMQSEFRDEFEQELLEEFLEMADLNEIETLTDGGAVAERLFPIASAIGIRPPIQDYLRKNPQHLAERSRRQITTHSGTPQTNNFVSLSEAKQLYADAVDSSGTKGEQICQLLDAAEQNISSSTLAEVVDCSVGHARRYTYDSEKGAAVEKDWSQKSQREKVSPGTRERIIRSDNGSCIRCGDSADLNVHHIIPVSDGGGKTDENLATLCEGCHKDAHDGAYTTSKTVYDGKDGFAEWVEN